MEKNMRNKNENVLLLSMSTLGKCEQSFYNYNKDKKNYKFVGYSQLEAGTKVMLNKLLDNHEMLDRIIIIHSKECAEFFDEEKHKEKIEGCYKALGWEADCQTPLSANSFYKNRIFNYFEGAGKFENGEHETWNEGLKEYKNRDIKELMQFVPMYKEGKENQEDIFTCLPEVCARILGKAEPEKVNLWVDTQGGRRNETFVMNCVINMLRIRKVNICEYYAVDYAQGKEWNPVVDVTLNNIILDLVSGMDMFISVARADKLEEYYKQYKDQKNLDEIPEDIIIDKIREVSDAIAICNMEMFEEKLKELRHEIEKYRNDKSQEADPIFMHLIKDLEKEYQPLFKKNLRISGEIRWCLNHNLYQQALTLTESCLPTQIFDEILSYDEKEVKKQIKNIKNRVRKNGDSLISEYKYDDVDHLVFGKWCDLEPKNIYQMNKRKYINCKTYNKNNHNTYNENNYKIYFTVNTRSRKCLTENELKKLIEKYIDVKKMRNQINHGAANMDIEDVKNCVVDMLKAAKCLD